MSNPWKKYSLSISMAGPYYSHSLIYQLCFARGGGGLVLIHAQPISGDADFRFGKTWLVMDKLVVSCDL